MTIVLRMLFIALSIAATTAGSSASAREPGDEISLRVMTFNVWLGGVQVDIGQVVAAIEAANADVVGLQEAEGNPQQIADLLGWPYVDTRMQIISRYPLIDPPGADGVYTFIEPRPGRVVAMSNVHLNCCPYGPEAVRDGSTAAEVLELEAEQRLPGIVQHLEVLPPLIAAGIPVLFTGDFNTPSHLDWTPEVQTTRPHVAFPMEWPVTKSLAEIGLRDSYREVYTDPVTQPGLTWTPGYPAPVVRPNETFDRIDLVLVAGPVTVVSSQVVGEAGGPDVEIGLMPWPSDHRAVVSELLVTPAVPPLLVAVSDRSPEVGQPLIVRFHATGAEGEHVALIPSGGSAPDDVVQSLPPGESTVDGSVVFGTGSMQAGAYEAVLLDPAGAIVARNPFWLLAPGAQPAVTLESATVTQGDPVTVRWSNAPGNRWDWIALYRADDPDLGNYLGYVYTGATIEGEAIIDEALLGGPIEPGDYVVRLMRDDGYVELASAPLSITPSLATSATPLP